MLLYFSVAGTCKKDVFPILSVVIFGAFSCDNSDSFTFQPRWPVVALQLKVAVDPRVALTDVGLRTNPGIQRKFIILILHFSCYVVLTFMCCAFTM